MPLEISSLAEAERPNSVCAGYCFNSDINELANSMTSRSLEDIIYEIYERKSDNEWERKQVIIQSRQNAHQTQDLQSNKKAAEYRKIASIIALSAGVLCSTAGAFYAEQTVGRLMQAGGLGANAIDKVFNDRRTSEITIIDHSMNRTGNDINEQNALAQKSDYTKSQEQADRVIEMLHNSKKTAIGS